MERNTAGPQIREKLDKPDESETPGKWQTQPKLLKRCARNCGIRHVTVPIATRILIANVRHIGVSNICVINLVYFKMQV